jgi:hypothetical protein
MSNSSLAPGFGALSSEIVFHLQTIPAVFASRHGGVVSTTSPPARAGVPQDGVPPARQSFGGRGVVTMSCRRASAEGHRPDAITGQGQHAGGHPQARSRGGVSSLFPPRYAAREAAGAARPRRRSGTCAAPRSAAPSAASRHADVPWRPPCGWDITGHGGDAWVARRRRRGPAGAEHSLIGSPTAGRGYRPQATATAGGTSSAPGHDGRRPQLSCPRHGHGRGTDMM